MTLFHVTLCRETPAETAARECFEESLGVFGTVDHLLQSLRKYEDNNVFKVWRGREERGKGEEGGEREGGEREGRRERGEGGETEGGEREGRRGRRDGR